MKRTTRVEPYIYLVGTTYRVRLAAVAGGGQKSFPAGSTESEREAALRGARGWRDRRATPAMKSAIFRASNRGSGRASTLKSASRSRAAKTGLRAIKVQGLLVAFDVTCALPAGNEGRQPLTRRFSVEKHGEEAALLYAVRQRLNWERQHWSVDTKLSDADWAELVRRWTREHPGEIFAPEKMAHPGCVTRPSRSLLQARVMVHGEMMSRTFSSRHYASLWEAQLAAIAWLLTFEERSKRPKINVAKSRAGEAPRGGVSRCVTKGRRGKDEVVYQVSYKDPKTGKQHNRKFSAGAVEKLNPEKEAAVAAAARAFRDAYENWVTKGTAFDPSSWSNWRRAFQVEARSEEPGTA